MSELSLLQELSKKPYIDSTFVFERAPNSNDRIERLLRDAAMIGSLLMSKDEDDTGVPTPEDYELTASKHYLAAYASDFTSRWRVTNEAQLSDGLRLSFSGPFSVDAIMQTDDKPKGSAWGGSRVFNTLIRSTVTSFEGHNTEFGIHFTTLPDLTPPQELSRRIVDAYFIDPASGERNNEGWGLYTAAEVQQLYGIGARIMAEIDRAQLCDILRVEPLESHRLAS